MWHKLSLLEVKSKLYSWQEKTAEVEFLHEEDGFPIPIEVKSGWIKQAKSVKDIFR